MSSASTGGTEGSSPASSPASAASLAMAAPKFGTLVPNRIFVGGISASTSEAELTQLFSAYGNVKAAKIISDRAGVSKGYGFVTFETDEEARRLQQESECIVLRERKLNIAPAIMKQTFNRSFDGGSGSPPAVPTSTYYYPNGMGLTYQNGLTFYNAGAPAPGTPIAAPTDSTTLYQTAGVFGPQATSGHQTFAPVVYSCPTPSLYMPQQYPYSPMTYESYYGGAAAGGGQPQYALYATSAATNQLEQQQQQQQQAQQAQSNGCVGVTGGASSAGGAGVNVTSASSPPNLASLPPPPGHFYAQSAPPPPPPHHHHHHHSPVASGPLPSQPQLDHFYYPFAAPGPPPVPPQPQHQTIGIGDQQLLLYTTDPTSCQQLAPDSQPTTQEDARSTSSHSDQPRQHRSDVQQQQQQHQQQLQQQDHSQLTSVPLMSLMPLKYPLMPARYTNYHPMAMHPGGIQQQQSHSGLTQHKSLLSSNGPTGNGRDSSNSTIDQTDLDDRGTPNSIGRSQSSTSSATTFLYPATVYIPHGTAYPPVACQTVGPSLLPTPGTPYDPQLKVHQTQPHPTKRGIGINNTFGISLGYHRTQGAYSILGGIQQSHYTKNQSYSRKYGNEQSAYNNDRGRYYGGKSGGTAANQQYSHVPPRPGMFGLNGQIVSNSLNFCSSPMPYNGQSYTNSRRNANDHHSSEHYENSSSTRYENSRRRDPSAHARLGKSNNRESHNNPQTDGKSSLDSKTIETSNDKSIAPSGIAVVDRNNASPSVVSNSSNNNNSPPSPLYSSMTHPIPNISPPVSQVQFYSTGHHAQSRYHHQQMSHQHQQQQQSGQRRYASLGQSVPAGRKLAGSGPQIATGDHLRRPKNKVINGIGQSGIGCKLQDDHCLGGGGDATGSNVVNRMPITPPSTPRNHASGTNTGNTMNPGNNENPVTDACHQIQALTL